MSKKSVIIVGVCVVIGVIIVAFVLSLLLKTEEKPPPTDNDNSNRNVFVVPGFAEGRKCELKCKDHELLDVVDCKCSTVVHDTDTDQGTDKDRDKFGDTFDE